MNNYKQLELQVNIKKITNNYNWIKIINLQQKSCQLFESYSYLPLSNILYKIGIRIHLLSNKLSNGTDKIKIH